VSPAFAAPERKNGKNWPNRQRPYLTPGSQEMLWNVRQQPQFLGKSHL